MTPDTPHKQKEINVLISTHIEYVTKNSHPFGESWVTVTAEDCMSSYTER